MKKTTKPPATVDEYIEAAPKVAQSYLKQMRKAIKSSAPKSDELVSYGMAAYKYLGKPLVYFAGYEQHIGFYATPTGHEAFKKDLSVYKTGKGSVQFPLDEKLPLKLIERIVKFRLKENEATAAVKRNK
ncbi:MAG: DUF1801 domain-containing protein [Sphingobacteriales bacterium]|nr:DUF1801 domain-containing protein [Sphingobacteriales bacterium]MBI3719753.1 DUF1801 domain-containing protein [Sphingobacteriales bacterium]